MIFNSLEDVGSAYVQATQAESQALFAQGEVVLLGVDAGFSVKDVVRHCASLTRRKTRTVMNRYAVARTFPPDKQDQALDWYMHFVCACTSDPYGWLKKASEGYIDSDGKHHDHTTRTLELAIKASGGKVDKKQDVFLLDGVAATIDDAGVNWLDLSFGDTLIEVPKGAKVLVTIVQPAPEVQAPAPDEENAAAV